MQTSHNLQTCYINLVLSISFEGSKGNGNPQLNKLNIKCDVIMSLHVKRPQYIDCTCKKRLIATYRMNTFSYLKIYSRLIGLLIFKNKICIKILS